MKLNRFYTSVAAVFALNLISGVSLALPASAAEARYITVSATGNTTVAADAVRINATVSILGTTNKSALSTSSTVSKAVRSALTAKRVATKDIATKTITIYPEYSFPASGTPTLSGYRATQSFDITIRSATSAGSVVDAIVEAGGENLLVNGVSPFVLDSDQATETARAAAVKKAKAKAASYAKLLGVKLGRIIYLDEKIMSSPFPDYSSTAKSDSGATSIDLGGQEISIVVITKWEISR